MKYFSLDVDLHEQTIDDSVPRERHQHYLDEGRKLFQGEPLPAGYRMSFGMLLGSSEPIEKMSDLKGTSIEMLVSPRAQEIFRRVAGDEQVQFVPVDYGHLERGEIQDPEGDESCYIEVDLYPVPEGYAWLNILNMVPCLDYVYGDLVECFPEYDYYEKKVIRERPPARILNEIRFVPDALSGLHIVRPKEFFSMVIISETLAAALKEGDIRPLKIREMEGELEGMKRADNSYNTINVRKYNREQRKKNQSAHDREGSE